MRWGLALIALALAASPAHAADDESSRLSLKELPGVFVAVAGFDEDAKRAGFDEPTFQADVERKLRKAGIELLSERKKLFSHGVLVLAVKTLHERKGEHAAFSVSLELYQRVRILSSPLVGMNVPTWSSSSIGLGDLPFVRAAVKQQMDEFVNAWLSVHPKPQESAP